MAKTGINIEKCNVYKAEKHNGRDQAVEERRLLADVSLDMAVADSLNRIYKKVSVTGLSEEASSELADDIRVIMDKFNICPKASVLLAAILEKGSGRGCDEEDLAGFIGCTNIEFLGFHDALNELDRAGIICVSSGVRPGIDTLIRYCEDETVSKKKPERARIGI